MTGTVTEILDCGHSYMIQVPNGKVYRRNRAHLKPICYDRSSFQDHSVEKEKKQPKNNSFQEHQLTKAKSVSFQKDTSYMDARSMLFDEPDIPQTPPSSPPQFHLPRSPSYSPSSSPEEPLSEDSSPEGRKRHQSEPAFIQTLCFTSRNITISTLQDREISQGSHQTDSTPKSSSFQDHL